MTATPGQESWGAVYRGVPVLVLGASGFIGRWVARRLTEEGANLTLGVRNRAAMESLRGPWHIDGRVTEVDLGQPGSARKLIEAARPAIVFNLAGYGVDRSETDEGLFRRLNAGVVEELVSTLAEQEIGDAWSGLRLVHAGSVLEYGPVGGDLDEVTVARPDTAYGRSKLEGTAHVVAAVTPGALDAVVARLFTVYGPGEHPGRLLPTLIAARKAEGPIPLTQGTQRRDFLWVGDVASGLLRLGATPAEGIRRTLAFLEGSDRHGTCA
jgi:nucleoside-diphosphate-sugar epimerase